MADGLAEIYLCGVCSCHEILRPSHPRSESAAFHLLRRLLTPPPQFAPHAPPGSNAMLTTGRGTKVRLQPRFHILLTS
eukprot:SAG25_NODE_272_length_10613_cov_6.416191_13_plen_78_part_00